MDNTIKAFGGLTIQDVDKMSHLKLCQLWRFAPIGFWQQDDPVSDHAKNRLFNDLGGITTEISKALGWDS